MDTTLAHTGTTTPAHAAWRGIGVIRGLARMNLGLVGLQAISAGFFLSGYGAAVKAHAVVALALQLGTLAQSVIAVALWRRRRVPARVAGTSVGLFAMVMLQVGLGYSKRFWLHVPIGVGLFGGLIRQSATLDTLWNAGRAEQPRRETDSL